MKFKTNTGLNDSEHKNCTQNLCKNHRLFVNPVGGRVVLSNSSLWFRISKNWPPLRTSSWSYVMCAYGWANIFSFLLRDDGEKCSYSMWVCDRDINQTLGSSLTKSSTTVFLYITFEFVSGQNRLNSFKMVAYLNIPIL